MDGPGPHALDDPHPRLHRSLFSKTLSTTRLTLRAPRLDDAGPAFERFAGDPEATRFLLWRTHTSVEQTEDFLRARIRSTAENGGGRWAICLKEDNSMWGSIAASLDGGVAEIGYMLAPELWGRGFMTEALNAVLHELGRHPTVARVEACCHPDNVASRRVLEKCGFVRESLLPGESLMPQISGAPQDCWLFVSARVPRA